MASTLYRIHPKNKILQGIKEIDFSDHNFKERYDIQEWVEKTPDTLGEKLLIIAKEKTYFDDTNERPDLIALDKLGNIVIIELKRDDSGINLEWQALKYASYWSRFKLKNIIDVYTDYLNHHSDEKKTEYSEEETMDKIRDFIDEDSLDNLNKRQRIILVSHRYNKKVITVVNWLIDKYSVDVKCVQLIPYYDSDKDSYYLQSNVILPVAGIDHMLIGASNNEVDKTSIGGAYRKDDEITKFFESLRDKIQDSLDHPLTPTKTSRWAGIGRMMRYYHFWYKEFPWDNWNCSYKVWLYAEDYEEKELRNHFGIYFDGYTKELLNNGVTENIIKKLKGYLKKINKGGFKFGEDNEENAFWIEKTILNDNLSNNKAEQLSKLICDLITETKEKIQDILSQK